MYASSLRMNNITNQNLTPPILAAPPFNKKCGGVALTAKYTRGRGDAFDAVLVLPHYRSTF